MGIGNEPAPDFPILPIKQILIFSFRQRSNSIATLLKGHLNKSCVKLKMLFLQTGQV